MAVVAPGLEMGNGVSGLFSLKSDAFESTFEGVGHGRKWKEVIFLLMFFANDLCVQRCLRSRTTCKPETPLILMNTLVSR